MRLSKLANAKTNGYYLQNMDDPQDTPAKFDPNKVYTAKEAAEHLPYSYKTVLKWIKARKIKASRGSHVEEDGRTVGHRKFLVKGQAILDFIDSNELLTPALIFKLTLVQMVSHWSPQHVEELAHDPAISEREYVPLSETELENLTISGKILNGIFHTDKAT